MISFTRNSFYDYPSGSLKYSEHVPPKKCPHHKCCNCTTQVTERPENKPSHVSQYFDYIEEDFVGFNLDFHISERAALYQQIVTLNFYWDEKPYEEGFRWRNPHAYFIFNHNATAGGALDNCISFGIYKQGYGTSDCFLGYLYFGKVDTSNFFNGHSPSRLPEISNIEGDIVWTYLSYNREVYEIFPESKEVEVWRRVYEDGCRLGELSKYPLDKDINEIYSDFVTSGEGEILINNLKCWFVYIIKNLEQTDLFKVCSNVYKKAKHE